MMHHAAILMKQRNPLARNTTRYAAVIVALLSSASWGACQVAAPEGWSPTKLRWDGPCASGFAHGQGVLKDMSKQPIERFFFGRLDKGKLARGVIDQPDGFVAGDFKAGAVLPSDNRQTALDAFTEAKTAAGLTAAKFRKAKNAASAKFYDDKAKSLADQMD